MKKILKRITAVLLLAAILTETAFSEVISENVQNENTEIEMLEESIITDKICISEVMFKNQATITDCDGDFSDWIELHNISDTPVNLAGWTLSDHEDKERWAIPEYTLAPDEYLVIYASGKDYNAPEMHTDFKLSAKNTVLIYNESGILSDSMSCLSKVHDTSTVRLEDGSKTVSYHPTPGYPNTEDGWMRFAAALKAEGPLQINEVLVTNRGYGYQYTQHNSDIVQIKNISGDSVDLSGYYLSDDYSDKLLWNMPQIVIQPGETINIYCDKDISEDVNTVIHAPIELSSEYDQLFITDSNEKVIDYAILRDIPTGGSYGRIEGENGWFYFSTVQLDSPVKTNGFRAVSETPHVSIQAGVYPETSSLTLELTGYGDIYYTMDGSDPFSNPIKYRGPITIDKTSVIRAFCSEEGKLPSRTITENYILNTPHDLPVLCIATDIPGEFRTMWSNARKDMLTFGNISFYDSDGGFSSDCGIEMKGWTSLNDPKKSLGIYFKGRYGSTDLNYDLFGNGVTDYASLSVRAGQDYPLAVIRNELSQTLCKEMTDSVYTQNSKYCVLYINGAYYGIYCIKENISAANFALIDGVAKKDVTVLRSPLDSSTDFYNQNIYRFSQMDMSIDENYQEFCKVFDINAVIDWFILEGYTANTDINGNMKYIYSEKTGLWSFIFYDLDWAFRDENNCFANILYSTLQITPLYNALARNDSFRHAVVERYSELSRTVLSDEHVLELVDFFTGQIESEIYREKNRWGSYVETWRIRVSQLRDFIDGYSAYSITRLCRYLNVTEEERIHYFGY